MAIRRRRSAAFTLIELMVVIVLLGILAAMVAPQFLGTYQGALLRSNARRLAAVVNLAHAQAVASHRLHRLRIEPSTGRYRIEARASGSPEFEEARGPFAEIAGVPGSAGRLDDGIAVEVHGGGAGPAGERRASSPLPAGAAPGAETIAFRPDGTADPRQIVLSDDQGFEVILGIDRVTSRVRIADGGRRGSR